MGKKETNLGHLCQYLPEGAYDLVAPYFSTHIIHLTLTRERKTILGDYRAPTKETSYHRITVNGNLNPYSFLITLLHELAHLLTYNLYKHHVAPHGAEWKLQFQKILHPFIGQHFFPKEVEVALLAYIRNPAASTCSDTHLYKALYKYDSKDPLEFLIEELPQGAKFITNDGRLFEKQQLRRTRIACKEIATNKIYLFPKIYSVRRMDF